MSQTNLKISRVDAQTYAEALRHLEQILDSSVSFLQSPLYGNLQELDGKLVIRFVAKTGKKIVGCGLAVRYTAPLGLNFLYCPYGPVTLEWTPELIASISQFFRPIARENSCIFLRIDNDELTAKSLGKPISARLARTASLQPRAEWALDITPPEEDLWMSLHKHARYNIRLAERANAVIKTFAPADAPIDDFFSLMQTTAERDKFGIFNKSYYQSYLDSMSPDDGFMTICYIDNKPAAAGLFVVHDTQAHYAFAGSSNDFRKIAPAYSVIWESIKAAKSRGCTIFNFGGVTDTVKGQNLGGVSGFKKRFGGYQIDHPNPVDIVFNQSKYALFYLYKSVR